jgi:hypothetical protein
VSFGNASGTDTNGSKLDVFLRDMLNGVTTVGSTTSSFTQLDANSFAPTISNDGRYLAWISAGAFDAADDRNGLNDVYVRAVAVPKITSVSPSAVARGTTTTLTVTGKGFVSPVYATVGLAISGVTVNSSTWVNDTTVTLTVTVDEFASEGIQSVELLNRGSGMGMLSGASAQCLDCLFIL